MKKNFYIIIATFILSASLLAGCGATDEKILELETAVGLMMEAKESAEEIYLDITDSSMEQKLQELDEKAKEYEELDYKKFTDSKIDEMILEVNEITAEYQSLQQNFAQTLEQETSEKAEAEKHMSVQCYLINKTGMNLVSVVLHDITEDTCSDNLLGGNVTLDAGYTLMGVVLDVTKASSEFEFVITNDNNTEFTLSCDDLSSLKIDSTSITLRYDSESKTGSASLFVSDSSDGGTDEENITSSEASTAASEE